jgi:hypothetical protein
MRDALGPGVPTIVLPGNHDRRWRGIVGPHRTRLFDALRDAVDPRAVYVAGCRPPFLAEIVPPEFHGLPADIVAYDSTVLPRGWVSAGGNIRQEDLLYAHSQLTGGRADRLLILLVHHHIIPTPLTDVSFIEARADMPRIARWLLGEALPTMVSNADREELTMTALGAGTALSMLHSFGRAVLLLHGHKHFPTARLVRGLDENTGDVLVASAGSGGRREHIQASEAGGGARLWPSFNVVRLEGDTVEVQAVSFSPKQASRAPIRRDLARLTRHDARWEADPVSVLAHLVVRRVAVDEAKFRLSPSRSTRDHWDYVCHRRVEIFPGAKLRRYVDVARPSARVQPGRESRSPLRINLEIDGVTRYEVEGGLRRSTPAAPSTPSASPPFEWVGLLCRYGGAEVSVSLSREHVERLSPFGSVTDLATGRERPARVESTPEGWRVSVRDCAPRTLLRIYWPL